MKLFNLALYPSSAPKQEDLSKYLQKYNQKLMVNHSEKILSGREISAEIREDLRDLIKLTASKHKPRYYFKPVMGVVLVNLTTETLVYHKMKAKFCKQVGIELRTVKLGGDEPANDQKVIEQIDKMANDPQVSGIFVGMPLPKGLNNQEILNHIPVEKDVDGMNQNNIGALGMKSNHPVFVPCTPLTCLELVLKALEDKYGVDVKKRSQKSAKEVLRGKRVCIIGRSNTVGMPLFLLFNSFDCHLELCHRYSSEEDL